MNAGNPTGLEEILARNEKILAGFNPIRMRALKGERLLARWQPASGLILVFELIVAPDKTVQVRVSRRLGKELLPVATLDVIAALVVFPEMKTLEWIYQDTSGDGKGTTWRLVSDGSEYRPHQG